ncbi:MAG: tetratricopeptide repeat protein [Spirochaetia bacterium]|nr:tetratricopeptide repeat protein [Spirochaetia bacterium]
MKKIIVMLLLATLTTPFSVYSQEREIPEAVKSGLQAFSQGEYEQALLHFRNIILDSTQTGYHGEAYYWIARSHLAQERIDKAAQNLDYFIANYRNHNRYPDALYQKGRILFLQKEHEKAIRALYEYIENYPSHDYNSNALFWIGESFYALGHFDKAEKVYSALVRDYPRSYKLEAARYRKSLIELKQREQNLLKLLKISHEEYLKALEDFQQRERFYEQAISNYQRKLSAARSERDNEMIKQLNAELNAKQSEIQRLQQKLEAQERGIAELQSKPESDDPSAEATAVSTDIAERDEVQQLLELKNKALNLKLFYVEWLQQNRESNS